MAIADEIAEIEAKLQDGASGVRTEGVQVQYDLKALERRLAELRRQQTVTQRPRVAGINLSNAF